MTSFPTPTEGLLLGRLSIRQALGLGLALMLVVAAVLAGVLLWTESRVGTARGILILQERSASAVERANLALLEARRYERDFLLRQSEFSVAEARSRYLSLFNLRLDDVDQALSESRSADEGSELRGDFEQIRKLSRAYRAAFVNVAELVALRGGMTSGLYGAMRRKGDEIEKMLSLPGNEPLLAEWLLLRRAKTDYILSGGMQYAVAFREMAQRVAARIGSAPIAAARKEAILSGLGQFHGDFEEYVALSERITADIVRFREAAASIQPIIDRIREGEVQRRDTLRLELQTLVANSHRITIGLEALGLLFAGAMAILIYRKIVAMIGKVEDFSARVGAGDFAARFAAGAGGEEARFGLALNAMADELQRSHASLAEQAAKLEGASRMKSKLLSSVSHEVKTPLNAIVGFADLLESGAAGPLTARQNEYAAQINASAKHLAQLIDRIVEATRVDPEGVGEGSTGFELATPRPGAEQAVSGPMASQDKPDPAPARVLLVDDHDVNRAVLARQLEVIGYECETAPGAAQALEKWMTAGPFGAMITDCNMPGMSGYELAQRVRELESALSRARMPIIAYTANIQAGEAQKCVDAGMDDCIAKPVDLDALREKLDRWLPLAAHGAALPASTPVDGSVLAEISGGDAALERQVIVHFLEINEDDTALLADALAREDGAQLVHAAHRMAGAGRTVGAEDFANVCAELEAAGRANDWEGVRGRLGAFHAELDRLNAYFRSVAGASGGSASA